MKARLLAVITLHALTSGLLTGCGSLATAPMATDTVQQSAVGEQGAGVLESPGSRGYSTQNLIIGPSSSFADGFSAGALDNRWINQQSIPWTKRVAFYTVISSGLKGTPSVVACGGSSWGVARFLLEIRQTFASAGGHLITFQWSPYALDKRWIRTAQLLLEASVNGGPWLAQWNSNKSGIYMINPTQFGSPRHFYDFPIQENIMLPAGSLKLRFVTVATSVGQPTPLIDGVVVYPTARK